MSCRIPSPTSNQRSSSKLAVYPREQAQGGAGEGLMPLAYQHLGLHPYSWGEDSVHCEA